MTNENKILYNLKKAFPYTIPVMLGYIFMGMAFGILFESKGYNFLWSILISTVVYAGSMQFVAINLFSGGTSLIGIFFISIMVNIRHIFYGLSMIDKFKEMKRLKPYMIFSLTDETYSLFCLTNIPDQVEKNYFMFFIALLNQSYWVLGSFLGSVIGSVVKFNSTGIDFAMTALFVVIFVEQWLFCISHIPAVVGILSSILCLILFGANNFLLPSMIVMLIILTIFRAKIEKKITKEG